MVAQRMKMGQFVSVHYSRSHGKELFARFFDINSHGKGWWREPNCYIVRAVCNGEREGLLGQKRLA